MKRIFTLILGLILCLSVGKVNAQGPTCAAAEVLCDPSATFSSATSGTAESGPNYGCLGSQPRPAWYNFVVAESGSITINITDSPTADIDFAVWGPFTGPGVCGAALGVPIACDYTGAAGGTFTITSAVAGEWYTLLVTAYSSTATNISLEADVGNTGELGGPLSFSSAAAGPFCTSDAAIALAVDPNPASDPNVTGLSFSGTGITDANTGTFDPATAGAGTHTITVTGTSYSCPVTTTVDVVVNICGCMDPCFTEYNAAATVDPNNECVTAVSATTACDDGNPMTINDMEILGADGTTVCTTCAGTAVSCSDPTTTQACNDNNPCTINDMETVITAAPSIVCVPCAGTAVDCSTAGQTTTQACDDGDACTINDMETTLTCDGSVCIPCAGTAITPPQPSIDNCVITVNQCDGTVDCMFHDNNPDTAGSSTPIITGSGAAYITDAIGTFDPSSAPMNVPLTIILNYEDPGTGCLGAPATCVLTVVSGHAASAGNMNGN